MKKVMFMVNGLSGGGAEKVLQTLLTNLNYDKYDITLYSMHREKIEEMDYPKKIHYKVVFDYYQGKNEIKKKIYSVAEKIKGKIFQKCSAKIFYRLFIRENYDVEIAFIEGESTKIISGSGNKKSKKYAWVHIDLIENPWTEFLYKDNSDETECYQKFDKVLCVSESVKDAFLSKFNIGSEKVKVQYNPIDSREIIQKAKNSNKYETKNVFRMIAVGRLVKQKGFDRLLECAGRLKKDGFKFEIYILGEGEERENLEKQRKRLQIEDIIWMVGFQKNPYSIMSTGDLLVSSSRSEGYSTVVTEGMVLGLPVVSTECAGIRELFGDCECGIITQNNTESLYEALKKILSTPQILNRYRGEVLRRREKFSLTNTMTEIEKILD